MKPLSRRRFLGHALGAGLLSASSFGTYRMFVPSRPEIILDYPGMAIGHAMRDAVLPSHHLQNLPTIKTDVAIIGLSLIHI